MDRPQLYCLLFASALIVLACDPAAGGDSLASFRSEARTADPESPTKPKQRERHDDDDHDHDEPCCWEDDDGNLVIGGSLVGWAFASPWWLPPAMIGDDSVETGYFARHPYARSEEGPNYDGYMLIGPAHSTAPYEWAGRVSGYYGDNVDSLSTIGGQLLLENSSRFGLDSTTDFRHQNLAADQSDELWTGDFNVVYRFAQSPRVQMRSGIGFNYLSDTSQSDFGFNFTYGGDVMLGDPWILSGELDLGELGETSLFHFRTTLGAVWHGVEVFSGYDYYDVGNADTSSLISGVRIWF